MTLHEFLYVTTHWSGVNSSIFAASSLIRRRPDAK